MTKIHALQWAACIIWQFQIIKKTSALQRLAACDLIRHLHTSGWTFKDARPRGDGLDHPDSSMTFDLLFAPPIPGSKFRSRYSYIRVSIAFANIIRTSSALEIRRSEILLQLFRWNKSWGCSDYRTLTVWQNFCWSIGRWSSLQPCAWRDGILENVPYLLLRKDSGKHHGVVYGAAPVKGREERTTFSCEFETLRAWLDEDQSRGERSRSFHRSLLRRGQGLVFRVRRKACCTGECRATLRWRRWEVKEAKAGVEGCIAMLSCPIEDIVTAKSVHCRE